MRWKVMKMKMRTKMQANHNPRYVRAPVPSYRYKYSRLDMREDMLRVWLTGSYLHLREVKSGNR